MILAATAAEILFDDLLLHLLWEEDATPHPGGGNFRGDAMADVSHPRSCITSASAGRGTSKVQVWSATGTDPSRIRATDYFTLVTIHPRPKPILHSML